MKIDLILFDWGWTLAAVSGQVQSFRRAADAVVRLLTGTADAELSESLLAEALAAEVHAATDPQLREVDLDVLLEGWAAPRGIHTDKRSRAEAIDLVGRNWVGALEPLPGALDSVRQLRDAGFRIGLVSNCFIPAEYCRREFARQGFADLLHFTLFSCELGYRKPAPIVYETALRRAGLDGRTEELTRVLFVGDSPLCDVAAPAGMGMKTALVQNGQGVWPQADYDRAKPDLVLRTVAELPALIKRG